MIDRLNESRILLNYIWFGSDPSKGARLTGVPGHDTQAVKMMAERIDVSKHKILFWCLDEYADDYAAALSEYSIQVMRIRNFLNICLQIPAFRENALKVISIMDEVLKPGRNTTKDRTSMKDLLTLFLLTCMGDYVLDSNVRPGDGPINLIRFDTFRLPNILETTPRTVSDKKMDVWLMFSPIGNRVPQYAFDHYCKNWFYAQSVYEKEGYSKNYHSQMEFLITNAIINSIKQDKTTYWEATKLYNVVTVHDANVVKYYFNTHKHELRSEYETEDALLRNEFIKALSNTSLGFFPPYAKNKICNIIFDYVADAEGQSVIHETFNVPEPGTGIAEVFYVAGIGDTKRMAELISMNININQQLTMESRKGETPLHVATHKGHFDMVKMLLDNGADMHLTAAYKGQPKRLRAEDFIDFYPAGEKKKRFQELYQSYKSNTNLLTVKR